MLSLSKEYIPCMARTCHHDPTDHPNPDADVQGFELKHLTMLSRNVSDFIMSFARWTCFACSKRKIDLTQVERQVGTAVIHASTGKIEKVRQPLVNMFKSWVWCAVTQSRQRVKYSTNGVVT